MKKKLKYYGLSLGKLNLQNWILYWLLFTGYPFLNLAQVTSINTSSEQFACGTFKKEKPPITESQGPAIFDCFGNQFSIEELQSSTFELSECLNSGIFKLFFDVNAAGSFDMNEKETICKVFKQASDIIAPSNSTIKIRINIARFVPSPGSFTLAFASGLYAPECGLVNSNILEIIKTGRNPLGVGVAAGYVGIRKDLPFNNTWYTTENESDPVNNPPQSIGSDKIDLHSVVLHEIGHLLGFTSLISTSGASTLGSSYSLWDKYLEANDNPLIIPSANTAECCDQHQFNSSAFPQMPNPLNGECGINLHFNHPDVSANPPVNSTTVNVNNNGDMVNKLSHLAADCPGGEAYVMHALFGAGQVNRNFTNTERNILCALGYNDAGTCSSVNNCVPIANDDQFFIVRDPNNNTYPIDFLYNDLVPAGAQVDLVPSSECGNYPNFLLFPGPLGWLVVINGPAQVGSWKICYTITSECDGITYCDQATISMDIVDRVYNNCEGCNLVCFGDFEQFSNNFSSPYYSQLGIPNFRLFPSDQNTPDILAQVDADFTITNKFMGFGSGIEGPTVSNEAIIIPLKAPIAPGCTANIKMKSISSYYEYILPSETPNTYLNFVGLSEYGGCPEFFGVELMDYPVCPQSTQCGSNLPQMYCMGQIEVPQDFDLNGPLVQIPPGSGNVKPWLQNIDFQDVFHSWTNNTTEPINFIIIHGTYDGFVQNESNPGSASFAIDDLEITTSCQNVLTVESKILEYCPAPGTVEIAYEICLDPTMPEPTSTMVNLNAIIPAGSTVSPNNGFDTNGSATISLVSLNGEAVCATCTLTIMLPLGTYLGGDIVNIKLELETDPDFCVAAPDGTINIPVELSKECPVVSEPLCLCERGINIDATSSSPFYNSQLGGVLFSHLETANNYDANDDGFLSTDEHMGCISVLGNLIIDQDIAISCPDIRMQPCSEITIQRVNTITYPTLNIETSHIYGCIRMWKGITVGNNCRLELLENIIEDAEFAVKAPGGTDAFFTQLPTSVKIEHNSFRKNHVAVIFPGVNPWISNVSMTPFVDNGFDGGALLPPCTPNLENYSPVTGYAGVVSQYISLILGTPNSSVGYSNYFSNLRNGVICESAPMESYRNYFIDIRYGTHWINENLGLPSYANSSSIAILLNKGSWISKIQDSYFERCVLGVYSANSFTTSVLRNKFKETYHSVELYGPINFNISYNSEMNYFRKAVKARELVKWDYSGFLISKNKNMQDGGFIGYTDTPSESFSSVLLKNTISPVTFKGNARISDNKLTLDDLLHGFEVDGVGGWVIDNNEVTFSVGQGAGFNMKNSMANRFHANFVGHNSATNNASAYSILNAPSNRFCCNTAKATNFGHQIGLDCGGTDLRHSSLNGHTFALHCPSGAFGTQFNKGNEFNSSSGTALHGGNELEIGFSQFKVLNNQPPFSPEMIDAPNQDPNNPWFTYEGQHPSCADDAQTFCVPPTDLPDELGVQVDDYERGLAQGLFDTDNPVLQREGERRLYATLMENSGLTNDEPTLSSFYNDTKNGVIGQMYEIEEAIRAIKSIPAEFSEDLRQAQLRYEARSAQIEGQFEDLIEANTASDSTQIYAAINYLIWQRQINEGAEISSLMSKINQWRKTQIEYAQSLNNDLPTTDLWYQNRKIINAIYLQTLAQDQMTLTPAQFEKVSAIAHQCVYERGGAVLEARILYQLQEEKQFNDELLCIGQRGSIERSSTNKQNNANITLVPNPAQDKIQLLGVDVNLMESPRFRLINSTGQLVMDVAVTVDNPGFDIARLPDGLYYWQILSNGQVKARQKLVIIH